MAIFKNIKKSETYDLVSGASCPVSYYQKKAISGRDILARQDWPMGVEARIAGASVEEAPVAVSRRRRYRGKTYEVLTASTTPSARCKGTYRRVAVVLVNWYTLPADREIPSSISDRARGVEDVYATWENCHVGKTDKSAYYVALEKARRVAERMNATK